MVERLFLAVPGGFLRFVIVVFPDHTHLPFLNSRKVLPKSTSVYNTDEYVKTVNLPDYLQGFK